MRTYRRLWCLVTTLAAVVSLVAAGLDLGWPPILGSTAALTALGALMGFSLVDDTSQRWRSTRLCGFWSGVFGALLLGSPSVIGAWSLLLIGALGLVCPPALTWVARQYRTWRPVPPASHPEALSDRELARRWRCTTDELRRRTVTTDATLALVQERSRLLDEMERRDPGEFEAGLVRAGWRSTGSFSP